MVLVVAVQFRVRSWRRLRVTWAAVHCVEEGREPNDAPKPPNQALSQWNDYRGGWMIFVAMPQRFRMNELIQLLAHDEWPKAGTAGRDVGWFDVAELELRSGMLWVGDPGFSWAELADGDGNRITLEPGRYAVRAFVMAFGDGNFIARLRVCSARTPEPTLGRGLAEAGTDSAVVGVCDAEEMLAAYRAKFGDDRNAGALFLENFDFERVGLLRVASKTGPALAYVQSGFGDGCGPVVELLDGQRRVGVELPFIEPGATA